MPLHRPEVTFPDRVWEPTGTGLWASRPATRDDYKRRGQILHELKATSNSPHIPFSQQENLDDPNP